MKRPYLLPALLLGLAACSSSNTSHSVSGNAAPQSQGDLAAIEARLEAMQRELADIRQAQLANQGGPSTSNQMLQNIQADVAELKRQQAEGGGPGGQQAQGGQGGPGSQTSDAGGRSGDIRIGNLISIPTDKYDPFGDYVPGKQRRDPLKDPKAD